MDDLRAVMDAVGSERAAIFGVSEGGNLAALFAATYPDRTAALALFGTFAKRVWSTDYPWAPTPEARERLYEIVERDWGGAMDLATLVPSKVGDAEFMRRLANLPASCREPRRCARAAQDEHPDRHPQRAALDPARRRWCCIAPAIATRTSRKGGSSPPAFPARA